MAEGLLQTSFPTIFSGFLFLHNVAGVSVVIHGPIGQPTRAFYDILPEMGRDATESCENGSAKIHTYRSPVSFPTAPARNSIDKNPGPEGQLAPRALWSQWCHVLVLSYLTAKPVFQLFA